MLREVSRRLLLPPHTHKSSATSIGLFVFNNLIWMTLPEGCCIQQKIFSLYISWALLLYTYVCTVVLLIGTCCNQPFVMRPQRPLASFFFLFFFYFKFKVKEKRKKNEKCDKCTRTYYILRLHTTTITGWSRNAAPFVSIERY